MKDSIRKSIGKNIRELREAHEISSINMAMELGYAQTNYSKIENGHQQLPCQALIVLCEQFGCRPERIVYGEKEETQPFSDYFSGYSEGERRRILKMLYLFLNCRNIKADPSFHKIFGSDILSRIPPEEKNILPFLLEYERKARDMTKRSMIAFLGISKNKYYKLLDGEPLSSIDTLMLLHEKLEYDMEFLLFNRVNPEQFLAIVSHSWGAGEQELFEKQMDLYSARDKLLMEKMPIDNLSMDNLSPRKED